MAHIDPAFRDFLDRTVSRPLNGDGYSVQVGTRTAVRYHEGSATITMFCDLVAREGCVVHGGWFSRLLTKYFGKYCLGIYIESPLRWDNDDLTAISSSHEEVILERVEEAVRKRSNCYRIDRGPNQQSSSGSCNQFTSHVERDDEDRS